MHWTGTLANGRVVGTGQPVHGSSYDRLWTRHGSSAFSIEVIVCLD